MVFIVSIFPHPASRKSRTPLLYKLTRASVNLSLSNKDNCDLVDANFRCLLLHSVLMCCSLTVALSLMRQRALCTPSHTFLWFRWWQILFQARRDSLLQFSHQLFFSNFVNTSPLPATCFSPFDMSAQVFSLPFVLLLKHLSSPPHNSIAFHCLFLLATLSCPPSAQLKDLSS